MDKGPATAIATPLSYPSFWGPNTSGASHVTDLLPLDFDSVQPGSKKKYKDPKALLIEDIPVILKNLNCPEAVRLYRTWLDGRPHSRPPEVNLDCRHCSKDATPALPGVEIKWDWYLNFAEAQQAVENVTKTIAENLVAYKPNTFWKSPFVQNAGNCIQECYWKELLRLLKTEEKVVFTDMDPPVWKQNQAGHRLPPLYIGYVNPGIRPFPLNDLFASLGNYSLRIYISGEAKPKPKEQKELLSREFIINKFLVRINDGFDFYGKQYLGTWGEVELDHIPSLFNSLLDMIDIEPKFKSIRSLSNEDFRKYQKVYTRGTNFRVFTTLMQIPAHNLPVEVSIRL